MLAIASQEGIRGQGRGLALIDFHEDGADCAGEEMLGLVQGWWSCALAAPLLRAELQPPAPAQRPAAPRSCQGQVGAAGTRTHQAHLPGIKGGPLAVRFVPLL